MKVAQPRSLEQATALAERHSTIEGEIATIEANRQTALAATNAVADGLVAPLLEERDAIASAIEPWWTRAAPKLTEGKRKSIELGGCLIGTRTGAASLAFAGGDDKAALNAALASPIKAKLTVLKRSLDKKAITALLKTTGAAARAAAALGFSIEPGDETFFISRSDSADAKVSAR